MNDFNKRATSSLSLKATYYFTSQYFNGYYRMPFFWILLGIIVVGLLILGIAWPSLQVRRKARQEQAAIQQFRREREHLEAKFFELASQAGKPRGLRWLDIEWLDDVQFARETTSEQLTAFTAVNLRFEAIEGGDMEDVEAVGTVREGSALFHFQYSHSSQPARWGTGGRALFNMNPKDAVERLQGQFEPVAITATALQS